MRFYLGLDGPAFEPKPWQGGRRDFNRHVSVGRPSRFQGLWLLQRRRAAGERDVRRAPKRPAGIRRVRTARWPDLHEPVAAVAFPRPHLYPHRGVPSMSSVVSDSFLNQRLAAAVTLTSFIAFGGCNGFDGENPCNAETGEIGGWVFYHDGQYIDTQSRPYAVPGDRPFDACTIIRGNISLKGEITDFGDFDHIESIPGFFESGSILEDAPSEIGPCGVINGFTSLKRITWKLWDSGRAVEEKTPCYYLEGFESLEFVGRDFSCTGAENLGTELREVGGQLTCPEERLQKLEQVGEIRLRGATLPNLRWAGKISTWGTTASPNPLDKVDLPLLEEVGPYFLPEHPSTNEASLTLVGGTIRDVNAPNLRRVDGPMRIRGTGLFHPDIFLEGRAEEIRDRFSLVEVIGQRFICENDPTDPCSDDPTCEAHYGEDSIECCGEPWPTCLEQQRSSE